MTEPKGSAKQYNLRQTGSGGYISCSSKFSSSIKSSSPTIHLEFFNSLRNIYKSVWKKNPRNESRLTNLCPSLQNHLRHLRNINRRQCRCKLRIILASRRNICIRNSDSCKGRSSPQGYGHSYSCGRFLNASCASQFIRTCRRTTD